MTDNDIDIDIDIDQTRTIMETLDIRNCFVTYLFGGNDVQT